MYRRTDLAGEPLGTPYRVEIDEQRRLTQAFRQATEGRWRELKRRLDDEGVRSPKVCVAQASFDLEGRPSSGFVVVDDHRAAVFAFAPGRQGQADALRFRIVQDSEMDQLSLQYVMSARRLNESDDDSRHVIRGYEVDDRP